MRTLVVYDSVHGNTEKIAKAIGGAIGGEVQVLHAGEVNPDGLDRLDLLIVGAPTHGGRPTPPVQEFLEGLPAATAQGMRVAAFDTRIPAKWVKIFSFAAPRIAGELSARGGTLVGTPEGFFVKGTKGPLLDGELERAGDWAKGIASRQAG